MAVAFLFGTWLALRESRRLHLDEDRVGTGGLVALVAGVLGARMLYVLEHGSEFRREWGSGKLHQPHLSSPPAGRVVSACVGEGRRGPGPAGTLFWISTMLYALVRIPLDFTRAYEPETAFLSAFGIEIVESQLSSLAI